MSEIILPIVVDMSVAESQQTFALGVGVSEVALDVGLDMAVRPVAGHRYEGDYTVTPADTTQTIPIAGLVATEDIIVEPIPNNYGLITWNGSTLTVS